MLKFEENFTYKKTDETQKKIEDTLEAMRQEMNSNETGYYKLPLTSQDIIKKIQSLQVESFSQIVIIGIGGSSLGIKAVDMVLRPYSNAKEILYLENSDPISINQTLKKIKIKEALFFVISKSGGTIETTSIFKTVINHFGLDLSRKDKKRVFAITDSGSNLSDFASFHGITQFNIPLNVGGRFSVLSAVGVAPLIMAGYDIPALLRGAGEFIERFFKREEEHLLQKALFLSENSDRTPINVLFSYADALENFTKWFVQLWAESLGKIDTKGKRVGLTPVGLIGAVDQHSFLQLVMEGTRDKTVTFIKVENFGSDLTIPNISLRAIEKTDFINLKTFNTLINAQCDATMQSLVDAKVSTDIITLDFVTPQNIGALIVYYELLTSAVGVMLDINTYNQPGVELGKQILYKNLQKGNQK
ncbi:MAG: glucose-6-phosphate isomerase [Sulfurospirillum sp.]